MNGWGIFAIVIFLLILIGEIRVGVGVEYDQAGLQIKARVGAFHLKVYPRPTKTDEPVKTKAKQGKKAKKQKPVKPLAEKVGGALDYVNAFVPLAVDAAGSFYKKLVMDELELLLTVGGSDPADTAMRYGQANAALAALWQPLTEGFHVKDGHAGVRVDFQAQSMTICARAALSLKIGQILWLGIYFGIKALAHFIAVRKLQKAKKQQQRKAV